MPKTALGISRRGQLTLLVAATVLAPALVVAQEHPHYADARTYLRTAQMLMRLPERPNVQLTLKPADDELDAAVREIDRAGVVDRKQMVDRPAVKDTMEPVDRFRSIVELLHTARAWRSNICVGRMIPHPEDNAPGT